MRTPHPDSGPVGNREEKGDAESSNKHPPHVENTGGPKLPANAHGVDKLTTEEQDQGIDDESMYDKRPSQDKDRPPSEE